MEPLLNIDKAATLLGLTRAQLYELTRNRSRIRQRIPLPFIRIGRRILFRAMSLERWITELERQAERPG